MIGNARQRARNSIIAVSSVIACLAMPQAVLSQTAEARATISLVKLPSLQLVSFDRDILYYDELSNTGQLSLCFGTAGQAIPFRLLSENARNSARFSFQTFWTVSGKRYRLNSDLSRTTPVISALSGDKCQMSTVTLVPDKHQYTFNDESRINERLTLTFVIE